MQFHQFNYALVLEPVIVTRSIFMSLPALSSPVPYLTSWNDGSRPPNTYFFWEWLHPDVEAGSEKEKALTEEHRRRGKMSVDNLIEAIRRIAIAGEL